MLQPLPILHLREDRRTVLSHLRRIALHNAQIRAHDLRQVDLVHDQQVRARDARPALAGYFVAAGNVDHVDDEVGQLTRVVGSQIVATGLDQKEVGLELLLKGLEGEKVGADVLTDGSMGAATSFDGADARRGEGFVAGEEFRVLPVRCINTPFYFYFYFFFPRLNKTYNRRT